MQKVYDSVSPKELLLYAEKAGLGGSLPADFLEFKKELAPGWKILEVGCGTGRLGILLVDKFDYCGIDTHQPYLDFFKSELERSGKKGFIMQKPFEKFQGKHFDAVLFPWTVIGDFKDPETALKKAYDVLKEGGLVILDNPARGTKYNVHQGYNPTKFYFSDWVNKFNKIGFRKYASRIYNTPVKRKRELILLYK